MANIKNVTLAFFRIKFTAYKHQFLETTTATVFQVHSFINISMSNYFCIEYQDYL